MNAAVSKRSATTGGIVLCGGRSSRMGQPKAWLPFDGELMLQRVVRIIREVVDLVIVVAAPGQDMPELPPEVAIVRDEIEGRGPLQGLATGLMALEDRVDCVYLSSCDVPFLHAAFVKRMISFVGGLAPPTRPLIAVPRVENRFHTLAAVYSTSLLPHIHRLLAADKLRPVFLFDMLPTRVIEPHELTDVDPEFESLRNLNTPEEYEAALRVLKSRRSE
ncbi:MAG TPA: molybdenum cofactor guanylyltransferase [Gemmata sp.]|nr:molybdenum cofactor guanylyltransferase [Gemmata sp.]